MSAISYRNWLRRRLRKLVREAFEDGVAFGKVDPYYVNKQVIAGKNQQFKAKYGIKP
jgi:hypothetical protein